MLEVAPSEPLFEAEYLGLTANRLDAARDVLRSELSKNEGEMFEKDEIAT